MHHVYTYISAHGIDKVAAADLTNGIHESGGMPGIFGELYDVDDHGSSLMKWVQAKKKESGGEGLVSLGKYSIIRYCRAESNDDTISTRTYAYIYSKPVQWRFEMFRKCCVAGVDDAQTGSERNSDVDGDAGSGNWDGTFGMMMIRRVWTKAVTLTATTKKKVIERQPNYSFTSKMTTRKLF